MDLDDQSEEPAESLPGLNARPEPQDPLAGTSPAGEVPAGEAATQDGEIVALSEIAVEPQEAGSEAVSPPDMAPEEMAMLQAEETVIAQIVAEAPEQARAAEPADQAPDPTPDPAPELVPDPAPAREPEMAEAEADRPKRRGWWSSSR